MTARVPVALPRLRLRVRGPLRCPFCHEAVAAVEPPCARCGAPQHASCWREAGGRCATCAHGRAGREEGLRVRVRARPAARASSPGARQVVGVVLAALLPLSALLAHLDDRARARQREQQAELLARVSRLGAAELERARSAGLSALRPPAAPGVLEQAWSGTPHPLAPELVRLTNPDGP